MGAVAIVVGTSREGRCDGSCPGHGRASARVGALPGGDRPARLPRARQQSIDVIVCAFDGMPERGACLRGRGDRAPARCLPACHAGVEPADFLDATLAVDPQAAAAARRIRERPLEDCAGRPSSILAWTRTRPSSTASRARSSCGLSRASWSPVRVVTARSTRCLRAPSRAAWSRGRVPGDRRPYSARTRAGDGGTFPPATTARGPRSLRDEEEPWRRRDDTRAATGVLELTELRRTFGAVGRSTA